MPQDRAALAEDFHDITTRSLTDRFGNTLDDGTEVSFVLRGSDGETSLLPAVSLDGAATAKLLVRDVAAAGWLQANLGAATSGPVALRITALHALGALTAKAVALPDISATLLTLGPFLTDSGHLLNDGAEVTAELTTASGGVIVQSGWVLDGQVALTLLIGPQDFPVILTVTSPLGSTTRQIATAEVAP